MIGQTVITPSCISPISHHSDLYKVGTQKCFSKIHIVINSFAPIYLNYQYLIFQLYFCNFCFLNPVLFFLKFEDFYFIVLSKNFTKTGSIFTEGMRLVICKQEFWITNNFSWKICSFILLLPNVLKIIAFCLATLHIIMV